MFLLSAADPLSALPQVGHPLVCLRPLMARDIEAWFLILREPAVFEPTSWNVQTPQDLSGHAAGAEPLTASSALRLAIALQDSDELIGTIGFHSVAPEHRRAEIAYDLAPAYWGRGIATEVCRQMVDWAHTQAGLVRVQATTLDTNLRSAGVLQRCGFVCEGLLRSYRNVRGQARDFHLHAHLASA